jgi:hypothetical protein
MFDFVKIALRNADIKALMENKYLEFIVDNNLKTGEKGNKCVAEYKGLKFIIHDSGYTLMQGSLHKYHNEGKHNYNDFTYSDLEEVLHELCEKFNIDLSDCILKNIEIGVNICLPFKPDVILNNLLFHKMLPFKDVSLRSGNFKEAEHEQYCIKVYDKAKHYNLFGNLMRYELKFVRMQRINKLGIYSLKDLLNKAHFKPLETLLFTEWGNVQLYDETLKIEALNSYKRTVKIHQWRNPNHWLNLAKNQRCREKKSYLECVQNHSENTHQLISNLIVDKWNELIQK